MDEKTLIKHYLSDDYEQSYKIITEKYEYLSSFNDKFIKIKNVIEKFKKDFTELFKIKDDGFSNNTKQYDYNELFILIKEEITRSINDKYSMINEVINNITNILELIKSNKNNYIEYLNIRNTFNSKLIENENLKIKYLASAEKAELFTYEFIEKNVNDNINEIMDKKNKLQNMAKEDKDKYIKKYTELNELFYTFNQKQKFIFELNKKIRLNFYENYINSLFSFFQSLSEDVKGSVKKEKVKNMIIKYTEKKESLESKQYKDIPKIELAQYKTKIKIEEKYNLHEIGIHIMACEQMTKMIGNYAEDIIEEYLHKVEVSEKIKRILNSTNKVNKKDEQYLKDILDTEMGKNLFIINFNQLRTKGQLEKSKVIIDFFGRMLNLLLEKEKEMKSYQLVRSCIILSQTFYYIDLTNQKKYVFDLLLNNKWLNSPTFWRNFIEYTIRNEFQRIKINKENICEILFSQLIPYIKNMKELHIDDRIIIKIIDEFITLYDKYDCFDKGSFGVLFSFINNDLNEIEKLRKEYKNNPDLEKQLYKDDFKENNNDNNNNENKK